MPGCLELNFIKRESGWALLTLDSLTAQFECPPTQRLRVDCCIICLICLSCFNPDFGGSILGVLDSIKSRFRPSARAFCHICISYINLVITYYCLTIGFYLRGLMLPLRRSIFEYLIARSSITRRQTSD